MSEEIKNKNSLKLNFGSSVICVPGAALPKMKGAKKQDILILLELLGKPDSSSEELAQASGYDAAAVESALAYWRGAGIITLADDDEPAIEIIRAEKPEKPQKPPKDLTETPLYSATEVAGIVDSDVQVSNMIDECEKLLGKMFGQTDTQKLVTVMDYFNLRPEYVLLVCAHCASMNQKSVGYLVKTISDICTKGITTIDSLNDYLFSIEKSAKLETQIRKIFGMNMSRELTAKERSFIGEWSDKFGYGIDIIRKAYDITINSIGEPSLNYANAVLSKWYTLELKTSEQIDAHLAAEKDKKKSGNKEKSFDSEDFFAAALERSYGGAANAPKTDASDATVRSSYGVKKGKV